MKRRTYFQDWLDWVDEHLYRMQDLQEAGANVIEVWPDAFNAESFRPLVESLGLEFNAEKIDAALIPSAWHVK